jgi:hypothetical protein
LRACFHRAVTCRTLTTTYILLLAACSIQTAPSIFKGPNKLELYTFASIEFDYDTHVCSIKIVGQGKDDTPLYSCRQCDKETWVIKKHGQGVIAQVKQVKGLMPMFTSWDVTMSPGVDAAFICCLTNIIDWFVDVLKKQWIKYYE